MAVKAVRNIFPVRNTFDNAILGTELLHLKTAETLCRCSVDGIEIAILFFKFIDPFINILQHLQCKCPVLYQGFPIIKLLQFIKRSNTKACCRCFQDRLDLVCQLQMSAKESTFTVSKRISGRPHFSKVSIGSDMKLSDQVQVIIKNLVKVPSFLS